MLSKPLLKQSIKANGLSWLLVTLATAFMLGILIIVLGKLPTSEIRDSLQDTFIESELEAQFKSGAIDGYIETYDTVKEVYPQAKEIYDLLTIAINTYEQYKELGHLQPLEAAVNMIVDNTPEEKKEQVQLITTLGLTAYTNQLISKDKLHEFKSEFVIDMMLTNMEEEMSSVQREVVILLSKDILDMYRENNELNDENMQTIARLFMENIFYQNLINDDSVEQKEMLDKLGYKTMSELLDEYGFTVIKVKAVISSGMTQYISLINNDMLPLEAKAEVTKSLLSQMPKDVSKSLQELGELDINNLVIGSIFFKISGLLLPIVYTITTANNLLANQVDSGSLAYVLSTPTKRRKVTLTQALFLIGSLFIMYFIIGIVGLGALLIVGSDFSISLKDLLLLNTGALVTMISISGICFLASAWFNRSKYSVGVGGGLSMFFLVSTILGLFGSPSIPNAVKIDAMNIFNYTSIISLFDANAILEGRSFIYGFYILLGITVITYLIGIIKFDRKDLPL